MQAEVANWYSSRVDKYSLRLYVRTEQNDDANNRSRAEGTSGYDASVDYVAQTLRDKGFEVQTPEYERLGMYTLRQEVLCYLAELGCRAGRWAEAAAYAADAAETVAGSGMAASQTHVVRFNQAHCSSLR